MRDSLREDAIVGVVEGRECDRDQAPVARAQSMAEVVGKTNVLV